MDVRCTYMYSMCLNSVLGVYVGVMYCWSIRFCIQLKMKLNVIIYLEMI